MSNKFGSVTCTKTLVGDCAIDNTIDEGGEYTTALTIVNTTTEDAVFCVSDQLPVLGASMSYSATVMGTAEGVTEEGEGAIEDTVTLGANSSVTYEVTVTTIECPGTSTNVASVWFAGEKAPKWVASNPVIVGCPELKAYPDDITGRRPYQNDMVLHGMFGVGNNERGQTLMDLCEAGFSIADLFTNPAIMKVLENGALKSPAEKAEQEAADADADPVTP